MAQWLTNPTRNYGLPVRYLALLSGLRIRLTAVSCGVGCRRGSDPVLLWLWHRLVATAPIGPLAWEPPYAMGMDLKRDKDKKKKEKKKNLAYAKKPMGICLLHMYHTVL